jgi:hypothetical protein
MLNVTGGTPVPSRALVLSTRVAPSSPRQDS